MKVFTFLQPVNYYYKVEAENLDEAYKKLGEVHAADFYEESVGDWEHIEDSFFQEISDDDVICPHCGYECDIGGLIGQHTNDCPKCGKTILEA